MTICLQIVLSYTYVYSSTTIHAYVHACMCVCIYCIYYIVYIFYFRMTVQRDRQIICKVAERGTNVATLKLMSCFFFTSYDEYCHNVKLVLPIILLKLIWRLKVVRDGVVDNEGHIPRIYLSAI